MNVYINDQLTLTFLKRWTSCLNCTTYNQWKKNRGKKAKVYFGSLCFYLSYLFLSFFLSVKIQTETRDDREVQTKKQHTTQHSHPLPMMTIVRSTNEYTHLSVSIELFKYLFSNLVAKIIDK
jgi:hypothetical protein